MKFSYLPQTIMDTEWLVIAIVILFDVSCTSTHSIMPLIIIFTPQYFCFLLVINLYYAIRGLVLFNKVNNKTLTCVMNHNRRFKRYLCKDGILS